MIKILAYRYKLIKVFEYCSINYYRVYFAVRTNRGIRKLYKSETGRYILFNSKRIYITLPT